MNLAQINSENGYLNKTKYSSQILHGVMLINPCLLHVFVPIDMARVAGHAAKGVPNLFSLECWGGATFDVSYRFLT